MVLRDTPVPPSPEPPSNDVAGLRALFVSHGRYVWNTLRRLGVSDADLEDQTHEVFLQVGRNLETYDPKRPLKPWLFAFCFRYASQYRRRLQRRRELPLEPELVADGVPPADERLVAEQDRQLVHAALARIELEKRAVFVLYEIDGETMSEIAVALGIPANTGWSRLRLARAQFEATVKRLRLGRGES